MFTGFASENTPAIQVWDFAVTTANAFGAAGSVSLRDDCAPIQYFKTGGNSSTIQVYLPSAPIEGKQIKIIKPFGVFIELSQIDASKLNKDENNLITKFIV